MKVTHLHTQHADILKAPRAEKLSPFLDRNGLNTHKTHNFFFTFQCKSILRLQVDPWMEPNWFLTGLGL